MKLFAPCGEILNSMPSNCEDRAKNTTKPKTMATVSATEIELQQRIYCCPGGRKWKRWQKDERRHFCSKWHNQQKLESVGGGGGAIFSKMDRLTFLLISWKSGYVDPIMSQHWRQDILCCVTELWSEIREFYPRISLMRLLI